MKYLLNKRVVWTLVLNLILVNYACNNSTNTESSDKDLNATSNSDSKMNSASLQTELKVGGLYLSKNENGKYSVSKIIAMDNFAIHVRMYADEFQTKPTELSSTNLKVLIGHAPMDAKGFLAENPELLKVEDVKDSELEGYKMYLEEMQK